MDYLPTHQRSGSISIATRLPLRGQCRDCYEVYKTLTHRLPVSSCRRLSFGHLKLYANSNSSFNVISSVISSGSLLTKVLFFLINKKAGVTPALKVIRMVLLPAEDHAFQQYVMTLIVIIVRRNEGLGLFTSKATYCGLC